MSFYTAGKIWHAHKFQELRDTIGLPVKARWIDLNETRDAEFIANQKDELWKQCFEDVRDSDFVLIYSEDFNEEQRGALVEVGMAYGMNKPVYAVGRCKTIAANEISDVAFTHYHKWTWLEATDLLDGALEALALEQYLQAELKRSA